LSARAASTLHTAQDIHIEVPAIKLNEISKEVHPAFSAISSTLSPNMWVPIH
jgi:hypothetical protein